MEFVCENKECTTPPKDVEELSKVNADQIPLDSYCKNDEERRKFVANLQKWRCHACLAKFVKKHKIVHCYHLFE